MAYNKIIYKGETLIDLTDLDVTEEDVASGKKFIKANGVKSTGTSTGGGSSSGKLGQYFDKSITEVTTEDLDGLKIIPDKAFRECSRLSSITIPDSVTSIGEDAFYNTAYYNNSDNWVDGVLYISNYLIKANSDNLPADYTIKAGTKCIADYALSDCTGLTSITIPDSITSIGRSVFYNCSGLTSVTLLSRISPTLGISVFENCTNLAKIIVPVGCGDAYKSATNWSAYASIIEEVSSIGLAYTLINDGTAYSVTGLGTCTDTDVIIPPIYAGKPVMDIRAWAFSSQTNLTSVTIPGSVRSMGQAPFYGCTSLERVTILDGATTIGTYAFTYSGLTSITIPNSVTSIEEYAFNCCSALASVTIPDSVTSIDYGTFQICTGLTSITIPDSVTSVDGWAFKGCSGLTSVTIGNSVTSIGDSAFSGCSGLTSITIPDSVTSIGEKAFFDCSGLTSVTMLSLDAPTISSNTFTGTSLKKIIVPSGRGDTYKSETNWSNYADIIKEETA